MRILFALSGLHRIDRGAEIAFTSIASELARTGDEITLMGSGEPTPGAQYRFVHVPNIPRERFEHWPKLPMFRNDTSWEEFCFAANLLRSYRPGDYDVTVTCAYPWTNWLLRRPARGGRPPHVFVTQNGDWPAVSDSGEFRFFGCEGLICINPDYLERNAARYDATLIPNGVDTSRFTPGPGDRERFALPASGRILLMVSALIPTKNVGRAIEAVSRMPDTILVVAGDGPLREELRIAGQQRLPGRYFQFTVPAADMPLLYRTADAFVHLTRDESFGNVFVEAMACGLPVVSYDSPRTRWILGDTAFLLETDDPVEIAVQLTNAMTSGEQLSGPLVERARRFEWANIASQYHDYLHQVAQPGQLRAANEGLAR